ncbi:MAG: NAD(P)H-hydrate dehydratase [Lewinellaceae bacterium]|nr:NAD(P)H-hydrate dehydratase [Lewinellaceae bacterium]
MKVFLTEQIRNWDAYTIEREPIASVDLMNRAARVFTEWFAGLYADTEQPVYILAGTGNNGGDGVAVARMLHERFYPVKVFVCDFTGKHSADFDEQVDALPPNKVVDLAWLKSAADFPEVPTNALLIDALFGSGLTRPLEGAWADVIDRINALPNEKIAIDLPSGLFADRFSPGPCVHAARTFSFERPKLAFFFSENNERVGEWAFRSIGLHSEFSDKTQTPFFFLTNALVKNLFKPRPRFSHKGTFGHALLCNGSLGKIGAAVLAAEACLRSGLGLLTLHTPHCGYEILQARLPEAMCSIDPSGTCWTNLPNLAPFSAIGAGCGIGQDAKTAQVLKRLIQTVQVPLVLDADALNLLAKHPAWLQFLPEGTILTPHPKEFERLFGTSANMFERNTLQRAKAQQLKVYIILKGAYTAIACPDGSCWFNSTGNPGMATGGSGDVLLGLLTGLLAQGYTPRSASLLGVWLHGRAGDLAAADKSQAGMTAGDIASKLGTAWQQLELNL